MYILFIYHDYMHLCISLSLLFVLFSKGPAVDRSRRASALQRLKPYKAK